MNSQFGKINTTTGYDTASKQVAKELRDWNIFEDWSISTKKDALNSGGVTVLVKMKRGGAWQDLKCDTFDVPEQNIVALRESIRAYRLADIRGITGLFDDLGKMLALQDGVEQYEDPWDVLGIMEKSSEAVVHAAYRDLMKDAHPDTGGSEDAAKRIQRAAEAMGMK